MFALILMMSGSSIYSTTSTWHAYGTSFFRFRKIFSRIISEIKKRIGRSEIASLSKKAGESGKCSKIRSRIGSTLKLCKRSEEHTSELQSRPHLVCRLLLEKKKKEI